MLSVSTGHDAGYLTGAVGGGREGYYTGASAAGEPQGFWYGVGAQELGLEGEVDADLMEAVYKRYLDPRDERTHSKDTWKEAEALTTGLRNYRSADEVYASLLENEPEAGPERREELRLQADKAARKNVSFLDVTFSAPKSVSVLAVAFERMENDARTAGDLEAAVAWGAHRKAVEDAVMAGSRAGLDYLQDQAGYSRIGHHGGGAGRWIDAHRFVVAQFLQHDSRNRDPQLHVHNAILNRVRCVDGVWRTLDSRAIHRFRGAAGAIAERVMEAHITQALGVRFETRADGKAREAVGVDQEVMDLFSSRRRAITGKTEKLVALFKERFSRDPNALEQNRLSQKATMATRPSKSHDGESVQDRLERWEKELRAEVATSLSQVAKDVLTIAQKVDSAEKWSPRDVAEQALAILGEKQQTWTYSDLMRAVSDALPGHLDVTPEQVQPLLEHLTDYTRELAVRISPEDTTDLPPELLLANGQSSYAAPGGLIYATPGQLAAEQTLRKAGVDRGATAFTADEAKYVIERFSQSGRELSADQAAALRGVLTSGAMVEVLSAPAGTGKSFTVGALADAWQDDTFVPGTSGRRVYGLAASQVATNVLAEEGVTARNITRWLNAQDDLAKRPDVGGWNGITRLTPRDLVVVDEAGMADTNSLSAIHAYCREAGAKLLLVGDPRQLAAVGAGGAMADLANHSVRYELTEVRRFKEAWEGPASLRLRDGDETVLAEYLKHGRIIDGGTAEQTQAAAARAWLADTLAGKNSLLLVGTNESAATLSAQLRADLVKLGKVEEAGVPLGLQGTVAGVGDLIQARHNAWDLAGYAGNTRAPINRETYRVLRTREDGGLVVAPVMDGEQLDTTMTLPGDYVRDHVALAYASTEHAAQGRTVDTAHSIGGTYVGMTRGRERNTAWVVTKAVPQDAETGEAHDVEERSARAVLAEAMAVQADRDMSALATQEHLTLEAKSVKTVVERLADTVTLATAGRTGTTLDRLVAEGTLAEHHRQALAADEAYGTLERLLRQAEIAGHDPTKVLEDAVSNRPLDGSRSPAQVIHHRVREALAGQLTPHVQSYTDLVPRGLPERWEKELSRLAEAADSRRRELGTETAASAPHWAVAALGPVPDDMVDRAEWEHRAGWAAAHRELSDHEDQADALGSAPPVGLPEKHASWRAAHQALDLPDAGAEEAELSDGQLRVRVRAFEREEKWAPRWVADELNATTQQAERLRTDATVWAARAEVSEGEERDRLLQEAEQARAQAAELQDRLTALEKADKARGAWYVHIAETRDRSHRARTELSNRGVGLDDPEDRTTAEEWLQAHQEAMQVEDKVREVTDEVEFTDVQEERVIEADTRSPETVPDIRETSVKDENETRDPVQRHRVPSVDETTQAVRRAQAALQEMELRRQAEEAHQAEAARYAAEAAQHARQQDDAMVVSRF